MAEKTRPCERCGVLIPAERIEALPETRVCVKCSEAIGGEFEARREGTQWLMQLRAPLVAGRSG